MAIVLNHLQFNQDIFEGWVMLVAAGFVVSMIWFMHKTARSMKGEIEGKDREADGRGEGDFEGWAVLFSCFCWCCAKVWRRLRFCRP